MKNILIIFTLCALLFAPGIRAQDFGIYDLSAKTNLDSTDMLMLSQASDSTYYKLLWDRIVDSVEDSVRGNIIDAWIKSGAAIALNKLASGTAAYFVVNNVSGVPTYVAMSGDATLSNAGVVTIAANAIGTSEITNGTITTDDISSTAAIALSQLATGTAAYIIVNNVSGVPTYVAMTGDATISNGGVVTIAANAITSAEITNNTVSSSDILDATIDYTDISANAQIQATQLETALDGQIIISTTPGVPDWKTISGDITLSNAGVVDLADALTDNFIFSGNLNFNGTIASTIDSVGSGVSTIAVTAPVMVLYENGGGTNITSITGGTHGTEVELIAHPSNSENIQITNNATINLSGAASWTTMGPRDVIRLRNYWGVWIETYRSNN